MSGRGSANVSLVCGAEGGHIAAGDPVLVMRTADAGAALGLLRTPRWERWTPLRCAAGLVSWWRVADERLEADDSEVKDVS